LDLLALSIPLAAIAFLLAVGFSRLRRRVSDQVWRSPQGGAATIAYGAATAS
jgi:hypothetical protein